MSDSRKNDQTVRTPDIQTMDEAEAAKVVGGTAPQVPACQCGCTAQPGEAHTGGCEITHGHHSA